MTPITKPEFIDVRCSNDKTLLFRARHDSTGEIEIKCRRCGKKRRIHFPMVGRNELYQAGRKSQRVAR